MARDLVDRVPAWFQRASGLGSLTRLTKANWSHVNDYDDYVGGESTTFSLALCYYFDPTVRTEHLNPPLIASVSSFTHSYWLGCDDDLENSKKQKSPLTDWLKLFNLFLLALLVGHLHFLCPSSLTERWICLWLIGSSLSWLRSSVAHERFLKQLFSVVRCQVPCSALFHLDQQHCWASLPHCWAYFWYFCLPDRVKHKEENTTFSLCGTGGERASKC